MTAHYGKMRTITAFFVLFTACVLCEMDFLIGFAVGALMLIVSVMPLLAANPLTHFDVNFHHLKLSEGPKLNKGDPISMEISQI